MICVFVLMAAFFFVSAVPEIDTTLTADKRLPEINTDVPQIENVVDDDGCPVITVAFIITVPGMFIVSLGLNFVCYKWGEKNGAKKERQRLKMEFEDTQAGDFQHYHNEDENIGLQAIGEHPGPSSGQVSTNPAHEYAAYDEIKDQRQRMQESQRRKEGGYLTPVFQDPNRPIPRVRPNGDGYVSPMSAAKQSHEKSKKNDSPSPPGNGGYLSPLQEIKDAAARLMSGSSDSSSNKSDKSDKSRKYQNEPPRRSPPKTAALYEAIKDASITQEHPYIDLQTSMS